LASTLEISSGGIADEFAILIPFFLAIGLGLGVFLAYLIEIYTKPREKVLERVQNLESKRNEESSASDSDSFDSTLVDSLFPEDCHDSPPSSSLTGENDAFIQFAPKGNPSHKDQENPGLRCFLVNRDKELSELKRSKASTRKSYVRLVVVGQDGVPFANKPFTLTAHGRGFVGRTNKDGLVQQEVPKNMTKGKLIVEIDEGKNFEKIIVWGK